MTRVANDPAPSGPQLPTAALGVAVGDLLAVESLRGARVVAGAAGLDRIVQRVNVMEVPDVIAFVRPHELLLTTGYPLRDEPERLARLVGDLHERGAAALAVKLGRYLDELPASTLRRADELAFPVLLLPGDVSFDDVLTQVLTDVLNRQAALLARSEEVHRALVQVVLDGGGLAEVATDLARILDLAVLVTTPDGRVVAQAGSDPDLARALHGPWTDVDGRFHVESDDAALGRHDAPGRRAGGRSAGRSGGRAGGRSGDRSTGRAAAQSGGHAGGHMGGHAVVAIAAGRVDHGRIAAFSASRPLTDADVHALERAATVCALAITKALAVTAVESRYQADFLRDLLLGRAGGPERTVPHAAALGWDLDRPLVVLVAEPDEPELPNATAAVGVTGADLRPLVERLGAAWAGAVRVRDPRAAVAAFSTEVVSVVGVPPGGDVTRFVSEVVGIVRGDGGGGRRTFSTGVSRISPDVRGIAAAYEQARKGAQVGRQVSGPGAVSYFDRLGVHRLLSLVPDSAELRSFVAETLGELARDTAEAADLRRTLEMLLDTNLNVAETARRLHFHYNTLRYRIAKLERMLGPFTDDSHLRLDLALALRVLQIHAIGPLPAP